MYATRPSLDGTTSCGSGPDGTVPSTLSVDGSTIESVRSDLASTSSDPCDAGCPERTTDTHETRARASRDLILSFLSARALPPGITTPEKAVGFS
jgi:hypothetical protein